MPATIDNRGYIRVVHHGFDGTLTAWRNQKLSQYPEISQMLCDLFNQLILVGNFRPEDWFPKERRQYLMKNVVWTWLDHKAKRPDTILQQTYLLKSYIIPKLGDKGIRELTRQDFYWIRENHGDTAMARQIRRTAQAVLNWAWKEGMLDKQLFLPTIIVPRKPTPYIELKDRWRIYDRIEPQYQDPVLLSLEMGMRVGEIVALRWDAIDFEHETIRVIRSLSGNEVVDMRKGGDEVWLPMSNVKPMLETRRQTRKTHWVFTAPRNNHMWPNKITMAFKQAARECGLPHARLHHCRNSFAIDLSAAGYSLEEIQAYLGHRYRATTEGYKGFGIRKLRAVRKMESEDG